MKVSEQEQEAELEKLVDIVKNSSAPQNNALQEYINLNSERLLLAYAYEEMAKAGFLELQQESSKFLIMAGINIVNCIASANLA